MNECDLTLNTAEPQSGGALSTQGHAEVTKCEFESNIALTGSGGAVHADGLEADLVVKESVFNGNVAKQAGGWVFLGCWGPRLPLRFLLDACLTPALLFLPPSAVCPPASRRALRTDNGAMLAMANSELTKNLATFGGAFSLVCPTECPPRRHH